jgi:hypothetical protein
MELHSEKEPGQGCASGFLARALCILFDSRTFCRAGVAIGLVIASAYGIILQSAYTIRIGLLHTLSLGATAKLDAYGYTGNFQESG